MTKDKLYFPHDSNARQDPKIVALISKYKMEGYAWWWIIIETLREQENYRLDLSQEYNLYAIALQTQSEKERIKQFLKDCITEFQLLKTDKKEKFIWSESLLNRMKHKDEKSQKARESAQKRWGQVPSEGNANALPTQSERNAKKGNKENKDIVVANATKGSIKINDALMPLEEVTYEAENNPSGKTKYGRKTMMLFARCYLEAAGIQLEPGAIYDANKISPGLSKLYKQLKDPDRVLDGLRIAGRYFGSKGLDWTPITVWKNWEKIWQWHKDGEKTDRNGVAARHQDVAERRAL